MRESINNNNYIVYDYTNNDTYYSDSNDEYYVWINQGVSDEPIIWGFLIVGFRVSFFKIPN